MSANDKKSPHGLSYILAWGLLFEVVFVSLFLPADWYKVFMNRDWENVTIGMGKDSAEHALRTGETWYRAWFVESGITDEVYNFFQPPEQQPNSKGMKDAGKWYFDYAKRRLVVFFSMAREICVRLAIIVAWLPFFVAVAVPCMWDGLMQWRRKQYSFDNASPIVHSWAYRVLHHYPFVAIFLVIAPIPIPAIILPIMAVASGYALFLLTAHTQKRL